ncbi:tripartite motif-containing protein 16-like [Clarias gariepinus]
MLAEVVEKLKKKTEVQAASPAHCYAGPGDVECDFCTGRKHKAVKSCLTCLASFCETHLKPHYEVPGLKKHSLVTASGKICPEHDEVLEMYCRIHRCFICYMCKAYKHKSHDTVSVKAYRTEKQSELKGELIKSQQRIQEKQKKEKAVQCRAERLMERLEQEIADLQRRLLELEQLSHTHNHIYFLQSLQSLSVSSGHEDSPSITVNQHLSFDGVRKSLSDLKKILKEFCQETFINNPKHDFCDLTLDPNTVNYYLILSEMNRAVTCSKRARKYSDHPERFDYYVQVLSKESVCGRCYWEVEWSSEECVYIAVSYKDISRKGWGNESRLGGNNRSWSLRCSPSLLSFYHNNVRTDLGAPSSSRIGVYVDHSAGTLSFYSVSDTMELLHRVHTTYAQPLYAGFWLRYRSTVRFLDI